MLLLLLAASGLHVRPPLGLQVGGTVLLRRSSRPIALEVSALPAAPGLIDVVSAFEGLRGPAFELTTAEYLTKEGALVMPPTGAVLTPSGWLAIGLVGAWSLWSPIGIRKYRAQLREQEPGLWPADPDNLTEAEEASRAAAVAAEGVRAVWRGRFQLALPAGFVAFALARWATEAGSASG